jgi:hypothetical protein
MMSDKATTVVSTRPLTSEEIARHGWVVEVAVPSDDRAEYVFFAVAEESAPEAEKAVLRFAGMLASDVRVARRRLSTVEISSLKLRPGALRPYHRVFVSGDSALRWLHLKVDTHAVVLALI